MTHTRTKCPNCIALHAGKKGALPAEFRVLASVFEKLATKLKQQLLKCKHTIQIATFNVRTLNRMGQLPELIASAIDYNIDIICIQEHRYTHSEDIKYQDNGNGWTLATASPWKDSVNAIIGGVGILIEPRALKLLNSKDKIHPRIMVATYKGNLSATIISCYRPINVGEDTELIAFYVELSSLVHSIPKQRSRHGRRHECPNREKRKPQIQPTQLVKQKWTTSNKFHDRKYINKPQYKEKGRENKGATHTQTISMHR